MRVTVPVLKRVLVCVCLCVFVCVCECVCMYVCMCRYVRVAGVILKLHVLPLYAEDGRSTHLLYN